MKWRLEKALNGTSHSYSHLATFTFIWVKHKTCTANMSAFQTHTHSYLVFFNNFCDLAWFLMLICWVSFIRVVQKGMKIPTSLFFNQNKLLFFFFCTFSLISLFSSLHPGLPSWEKSAKVFGVHGLLDEQVDLSSHAEHRSLFHSLELLLQPQQHPLRHLVEALTVTAGKNMRGRAWTHTHKTSPAPILTLLSLITWIYGCCLCHLPP